MAKGRSIEQLLSPSLRVSRPVAACPRCRSAKIKCDGLLPCTACERAGKASTCTGANDDFARGKERSYVAALEAASARLQKRLAEARSYSATSTASSQPATASIGGANSRPSPQPRNVSGTRKREASDVDDLVSDFGFLSVNATSRDFHGFAQIMSFARLLLSVSMTLEIPKYGPSQIPPRYAAMPLIQHYLDNIYVLMPFFSEIELMTCLSCVYQEAGRQASPLDHWNFRMVLAIAAGATSKVKGDDKHQLALEHASAALEHAEMVLHPGSMTGLQSLLLLVQYSLVDPEHLNSWYLVGMASRVMVDLGLHQELAPEVKVSKRSLDIRRRLFYCVYALDRNISSSLERTFSFTDDSASDVCLPSISTVASPGAANRESQMFLRSFEPSLFLFDIRRVQSALYQSKYCSSREEWPLASANQYVSSILSDIQAWYATIPASISGRHRMFFNLEYFYSEVLVLAPSEQIPLSNMSESSKRRLFQCTVQYTELMQQTVHNSDWHAFLTYADICRVKFVGQQYLDVMWSNLDLLLSGARISTPEPQFVASVEPNINNASMLDRCTQSLSCLGQIVDILDYARRRWGLSHLRERFEQASAVLRGRLKNKQQELSAKQYAPASTTQQQQGVQMMPAFMFGEDSDPIPQTQVIYSTQESFNISPQWQISAEETDPRPPYSRGPSSEATQDLSLGLPSGSLPRRTYDFLGGGSGA